MESHTMKANPIGKQAFVDTTLRLLDDGLALRELNLRRLARELGCAHTNAYNYVSSFEELLWYALASALEQLMQATKAESTGLLFEENSLLDAYCTFTKDHPAWFRLIWIEQLGSNIPADIVPILDQPSHMMRVWLKKSVGDRFDEETIIERGEILFSFLHGQLCLLSTGRMPLSEYDGLNQRIDALARLLFSP